MNKMLNLDIQRFADPIKITRDEVASYLDINPSGATSWGLVGIGVTSYGISYNPQVTTEKWIINKGATSTLDSYQKQGDITQNCYKNDVIFEYVNGLRRTAGIGSEAETSVLDIDIYDEVSDGVYRASKHSCIIAITNYMSDVANIEYSIYYNGDPVLGTVTFTDGVPTFTETPASL